MHFKLIHKNIRKKQNKKTPELQNRLIQYKILQEKKKILKNLFNQKQEKSEILVQS